MHRLLAALLLAFWLAAPPVALAKEAPKLTTPSGDTSPTMSKQELDQLLAPIALYPDDLTSSVLMASTYPLDVVQAARWRGEGANAKLKGDALVKALEAEDSDPSVKALVQFPDVLKTMSDKLDWTQKLGEAFLAQQDDVMDEIQLLRQKADEAGNLKSNKQQRVSKEGSAIVIAPANPEVVYVPVYQPSVVYGPWWYPDYPPYYWPPYYGNFSSGFFWAQASRSPTRSGAGATVTGTAMTSISTSTNGTASTSTAARSRPTNGRSIRLTEARCPQEQGRARKFGQGDRTKPANKDFRGFDKGTRTARKLN